MISGTSSTRNVVPAIQAALPVDLQGGECCQGGVGHANERSSARDTCERKRWHTLHYLVSFHAT